MTLTVLGSISVSGGDTGRGPPALPVPGGGGAPPARPQPSAAVPAVPTYHPGTYRIWEFSSFLLCKLVLAYLLSVRSAMLETKGFFGHGSDFF